jgi:hypothetical protein
LAGKQIEGKLQDARDVEVANVDIPIIVIGFVLNPPTLLTGQNVDPRRSTVRYGPK